MRHLGLLVVPVLVSACGVQLRAVVPEPVVTVAVATPPDPPAPPAAEATVDVEAAPVPAGDPEEMTATSEPPDPVYEEPTDSPDPTYIWVGGYWGWNGVDWGWNWGRWAPAPEGQVYIAPYYERVGDSVVFVSGYWGRPDAPVRSYGGERIRFAAAVRPANYRRGEHVVVEHRAGPPPGRRPGAAYEHAAGASRPMPHETAPQRIAAAHPTTANHRTSNRQETAPGHEAAKSAPHAAPAARPAPSPSHASPAAQPRRRK